MFDPRMYLPKRKTAPKLPASEVRLPSLAYVRLLHALVTSLLTQAQREMLETLVTTGQDSIALPSSNKPPVVESIAPSLVTEDMTKAKHMLAEQDATISKLRRQLTSTRQVADSLSRRVSRLETDFDRINRFTS